MYIPQEYKETCPERIAAFLASHSFAQLCVATGGELHSCPVSTLYKEEESVIYFHLAAQNPISSRLEKQPNVLLVIQGENSFISTVHYQKQNSVPTWNYMQVQVRGEACLVENAEQVMQIFSDMYMELDPASMSQWHAADDSYLRAMLGHLKMYKLSITELPDAAFKLSQDKPVEIRKRIAATMVKSGKHELADEMRRLEHISR